MLRSVIILFLLLSSQLNAENEIDALESRLEKQTYARQHSVRRIDQNTLEVTGYLSEPMRLQYKPPLSHKKRYATNDYELQTLAPSTERRTLIKYNPQTNRLEVYYAYARPPKLGQPDFAPRIAVSPEAGVFLAEHFQELIIDAPMLLLGLKYLQGLKQFDDLSLHHRYELPSGTLAYADKNGVITSWQPLPWQSSPVKKVGYIQTTRSSNDHVIVERFFVNDTGLERRRVDVATDREKPTGIIPLETIEAAIQTTGSSGVSIPTL